MGDGGGLDLTFRAESVECARQDEAKWWAVIRPLRRFPQKENRTMAMKCTKIPRMTKKVDRRVGKRK